MFKIRKYNNFWAVRDKWDELIAVIVYKKGAEEIVRRLEVVNNKVVN